MTTKLSAVLRFGGKVDGSLKSANKTIAKNTDRLGAAIATITKRQAMLTRKIKETRRAGKSIKELEAQYRRLDDRAKKLVKTQNRLKVAQEINLKNAAALGVGIGAGAAQAARRAQALTGAPGAAEGLSSFVQFNQALTRLSNQANLTAEQQGKLKEAILNTSNATNVAARDLLAGIDKAQEKFSDPAIVTDNLALLGKTANALNASFPETVNAIGQFVQNMGVAKDEIPALVGAMEQAQRAGAVTVADLASTFAQSIGLFSSVTGQKGDTGARSFLATSQVLAKGGANREQIRTQLEATLGELIRGDVRGKLARRTQGDVRAGLRGKGPIDIAGLVEQLAADPKVDAVQLGKIFGSKEAVKAFTTLIEQTRKSQAVGEGSPLRDVAAVDASKGIAAIEQANKQLVDSADGRVINARIEAENRYISNSENLAENASKLSKVISELTGKFPLLTEAVTTIATVIGGTAITKVLTGGKGKGLIGALGKIGKAGGIGAGAKALGGGLATKAGALAASPIAKVAAAGAGGYAFGTFLNKTFDLENKINDFFGAGIAGGEAYEGPLKPLESQAPSQTLLEKQAAAAAKAASPVTTVSAQITVHPAQGQNEEQIAEEVVRKLNRAARSDRDSSYGQ